MFDIGFSEIVVIFGLALVVLGPDKLPRIAQTVGRWAGRARAMARQFRDQLEEEASQLKTAVDPNAPLAGHGARPAPPPGGPAPPEANASAAPAAPPPAAAPGSPVAPSAAAPSAVAPEATAPPAAVAMPEPPPPPGEGSHRDPPAGAAP
jgi:sec-independent protein translocase protein TatB